jgi:hypothetical protein
MPKARVILIDGKPYQKKADGSLVPLKGKTDWKRLDRMTSTQVKATAASDRNGAPMTDAEWAKAGVVHPHKVPVQGNVVADQQLPFSNKSHTRIVDDLGERTVRVIDLCERLQVDGLIRLHHRDYDLVETLAEKYAHFNLEFTLNECGKRYAVLPIVRSGYRTESDDEVLPMLDPRRHRIGICEAVMQRVPIEEVSPSAHFSYSIITIRTIDELKKALIQRYAPLFPNLQPEQLLARGCAVTLISF